MDDARALVTAARLALPRDVAAAAQLLTRSLEFMAPDDPQRDEVVLELVPAAVWAGRAREAEVLARGHLSSAEPPAAHRLRLYLAQALGVLDRWSDATEVLRALAEDPGVPDGLRWQVLGEHAHSLAVHRELAAARRRATEVLSSEEGRADTLAAFAASLALADCLFFEGRCDEAAEKAAEVVALVDAAGELVPRWRNPRLLLGLFTAYAGRLDEGAAILEDAREVARRTGALWSAPAYQLYLATTRLRQGRWDEAAAEFREGLRICEAAGASQELATLLGAYATLEARRGAFQRAERLVARLDEVEEVHFGDRAWRALAVAIVAEGSGRPRDALDELAHVWRRANELEVWLPMMNVAPDLARLAARAGDATLCASLVRWFGELAAGDTASASVRALAAHVHGVAARSAEHLEAAIAGYGSAGQEPSLALAAEELAVVEAELGRPRKALAVAREALRRFDAMGAVVDARRTRARLRNLDVATPPPPAEDGGKGAWASLTRTEKAVVELVAEGLKNREIAERMFVSVQTVQTHLKHVFKKLGVASRSQLVRAALEVREPADDAGFA